MFKNPKKATRQTRHGYEQKNYIQGLPAQNNFHQFLLSTDDIVKRMKGLGFTIAFKT